MTELPLNLVKAGSVVIFLLALDFVVEMMLSRNIKDRRKSLKLRVFLRYVLVFIFFFSMAKIWVEGFGYFLTFIGFIAAALTITQKEYIMNFVGWLIIMWRDLFTEGDYIEVGRYCGFVKSIGPLYFSLEEVSDIWGDKTGRTIKIPNSLIATNPVINFSTEASFIESKAHFVFSVDSSVDKIRALIVSLENEMERLLSSLYGNWTSKQQKQHNRLSQFSYHKPQFILRVYQDKPIGLQLKIRYLSLKHDRKNIEDNIFTLVMKAVNENEDLELSTEI
jgi:small-conductance mechanosensitive channel